MAAKYRLRNAKKLSLKTLFGAIKFICAQYSLRSFGAGVPDRTYRCGMTPLTANFFPLPRDGTPARASSARVVWLQCDFIFEDSSTMMILNLLHWISSNIDRKVSKLTT